MSKSTTPEALCRVGRSAPRIEDLRLLRGEGCYLDDVQRDGTAFAVIVRSPHAHADITGIDVHPAFTLPGVLAIVTADDLATAEVQPTPPAIHTPRKLLSSMGNHCWPVPRCATWGRPSCW